MNVKNSVIIHPPTLIPARGFALRGPGSQGWMKQERIKEKVMCHGKQLKFYNQMGMQLASQGEHKAALMLLGRALRQTRAKRSAMYEAKIRQNMALVLLMSGRNELSQRQFHQAMRITEHSVGTDNRFYQLLVANQQKAQSSFGRHC